VARSLEHCPRHPYFFSKKRWDNFKRFKDFFLQKQLKSRPESGPHCLICNKIDRQRCSHCGTAERGFGFRVSGWELEVEGVRLSVRIEDAGVGGWN
jgi:hypothetical protein